jgi:hypothetical protein
MAHRLSCSFLLVAVVYPMLITERGDAQSPAVAPRAAVRFKFKIDPKTPLGELLPVPLNTPTKLPLWTNENLAKVPELTFGEPISKALAKEKAMETTAHVMAKINHLNLKKTDGFMLAMIEKRPDLRGLPFLMGDNCRTGAEQAKAFAVVADSIRQALDSAKARGADREARERFWSSVWRSFGAPGADEKCFDTSLVAALTQILMRESGHFQLGLAKRLATMGHVDATKALANLAIFSSDEDARDAAIEGLKQRPKKEYTDILLQGFRYPLPMVSQRAAEALVNLQRKDLLANIVEMLDSPDPRLPVTEIRDGKEVTFVRELVRVNHHRNCLLCHAPGNTDNTPEGVLKVAVPLPGEPLPEPGAYQSVPPPSPDVVVRLDMTYLRQDFSLMMPVGDAHPWPEMQRFDFLVRTRVLSDNEVAAHVKEKQARAPGQVSENHKAVAAALNRLTGKTAAPTEVAWAQVLDIPAPQIAKQ